MEQERLQSSASKVILCKYCGTSAISKCGSYKGVPRYFCKLCHRKFKLDNHLFHMHLPAEYVSKAIEMYYENMSINSVRRYLKTEYNYCPSGSTVYQWLMKYSNKLVSLLDGIKPEVGNIWLLSGITKRVNDKQLRIYYVMDEKTHFCIYSFLTASPIERSGVFIIKEASSKISMFPKTIFVYLQRAYLTGLQKEFNCEVEHIGRRQVIPSQYDNLIENYRNLSEPHKQFMKKIRTLNALQTYHRSWLMYYNFFKIQTSLGDKTPANAANINFNVKTWYNLVKI